MLSFFVVVVAFFFPFCYFKKKKAILKRSCVARVRQLSVGTFHFPLCNFELPLCGCLMQLLALQRLDPEFEGKPQREGRQATMGTSLGLVWYLAAQARLTPLGFG